MLEGTGVGDGFYNSVLNILFGVILNLTGCMNCNTFPPFHTFDNTFSILCGLYFML